MKRLTALLTRSSDVKSEQIQENYLSPSSPRSNAFLEVLASLYRHRRPIERREIFNQKVLNNIV